MADIRLQLARYAQGIHWVQKNFLLDESISAVLITAGPMPLRMSQQATAASNRQSSHFVLQMQPDFNTPFPAPESWNQQVTHGGLASHSALRCSAVFGSKPCLGSYCTTAYELRHNLLACPWLRSAVHCQCMLPQTTVKRLQDLTLLRMLQNRRLFHQAYVIDHVKHCVDSMLLQAGKGEVADIVRVFLQTPTGSCHVDITKAILKSHLQVPDMFCVCDCHLSHCQIHAVCLLRCQSPAFAGAKFTSICSTAHSCCPSDTACSCVQKT